MCVYVCVCVWGWGWGVKIHYLWNVFHFTRYSPYCIFTFPLHFYIFIVCPKEKISNIYFESYHKTRHLISVATSYLGTRFQEKMKLLLIFFIFMLSNTVVYNATIVYNNTLVFNNTLVSNTTSYNSRTACNSAIICSQFALYCFMIRVRNFQPGCRYFLWKTLSVQVCEVMSNYKLWLKVLIKKYWNPKKSGEQIHVTL